MRSSFTCCSIGSYICKHSSLRWIASSFLGLPLVLIIASIIALYGKIKNTLPWYLPVNIVGTVLSFLSIIAGSRHIEAFHRFESEL